MLFGLVLLVELIPVHPAQPRLLQGSRQLYVFSAHLGFVYRSSEHLDLIMHTNWHVSHLQIEEENMPGVLLHEPRPVAR